MQKKSTVAGEGECHCGAVKFRFNSLITELTTCDCSLCSKKNALMLKVHESEFELLAGENNLAQYQFHTNTARHYFCRTCGIYPFHRKRVTPDFYGINVRCLTNFPLDDYRVRETNGSSMA